MIVMSRWDNYVLNIWLSIIWTIKSFLYWKFSEINPFLQRQRWHMRNRWIESFTFSKLWQPLRVLDCKLDQSKDIVEFGTLSQFDVDAESQYFWGFCNGGSVTTGVIKDKGCWVLKSMMVMVMMMVIIFWQAIVPKHDGDDDDDDDDGDDDGDHLGTTSCSKAWDLSSGGGTGGQHDSLPKASQHKPIICWSRWKIAQS